MRFHLSSCLIACLACSPAPVQKSPAAPSSQPARSSPEPLDGSEQEKGAPASEGAGNPSAESGSTEEGEGDRGDARRSDDAAETIATRWFGALTRAEVQPALEASGLPFSLDGRKVLDDREALASVYRHIAETKGKRELAIDAVEIVELTPEQRAEAYRGDDEATAVGIFVGEKRVLVFVREDGLVVGFRD